MRIVIALILVFITATLAWKPSTQTIYRPRSPVQQFDSESDWSICYKDICYNRDQIESEFLPALAPAAIFAGKALAAGALGAAGKHAYDKFIRRRDSQESDFPIVPVALGAWKVYNALKRKDSVESDAEFLGKLISKVKNIAGKVKGVVEKGKAAYANGKNIFDSAKNIIGLFKKNKQQALSDYVGVFPKGRMIINELEKKQPARLFKDVIAKLSKKNKQQALADILGLYMFPKGKMIIKGLEKKQQALSDYVGVFPKGRMIINELEKKQPARLFKDVIAKLKEKAKSKKQQTESDFLGALKLGMMAFKAIKGLKKNKKSKAQPESDYVSSKKYTPQDWINAYKKFNSKKQQALADFLGLKTFPKGKMIINALEKKKPSEETRTFFKDVIAKLKDKIKAKKQQTESDYVSSKKYTPQDWINAYKKFNSKSN